MLSWRTSKGFGPDRPDCTLVRSDVSNEFPLRVCTALIDDPLAPRIPIAHPKTQSSPPHDSSNPPHSSSSPPHDSSSPPHSSSSPPRIPIAHPKTQSTALERLPSLSQAPIEASDSSTSSPQVKKQPLEAKHTKLAVSLLASADQAVAVYGLAALVAAMREHKTKNPLPGQGVMGVGHRGLEPRTSGLRVRCSTN